MDLRDQLLESSDRKQEGVGKYSIASIALHGGIIAAILFLSTTATHKVDAEQPIHAFFAQKAAPPPPPPPPPPAGSSAPTPAHVATPKPVVVHQQAFVQPTQTPQQVPKVEPVTTKVADVTPSQPVTDTAPATGEAGGVQGGVAGGVAGGVQGGVVGGQVGGVVGGQLGGVVGGTPGGTGTGTGDGNGNADVKPVEPPKDDGPMRVGGDVKAPVVIRRIEPKYSESARHAHTQGIVIVEAIIDKNGNVDQVKVIKGLPMGLSEAAEEAVREWKFKPATLNGEPVDVIFNLTVNFTLGG